MRGGRFREVVAKGGLRGSNIGLAGCGMRLKIEAGCGKREILKAGCGMKTERRDWDILRFLGGIRDRTGICEIIS